ncbi:putative dehydroquinase class II [Acaromyces ingoldii]|uniref:Catabolic 3-dehydroquinase n=1 Tax=Acaromyces ingoldii TaxID=215250 RepID=A0A316YKF8_9BASI|nr:putative dehydroquinase class II [Acaromyces ingoldii]PWN89699.1 putative dehydroquinase class II [Acaromyces ingoldii]
MSSGKILVLNGPNLNLLGVREPQKYGYTTLVDILAGLEARCAAANVAMAAFQSNAEGAMIDRIHAARTDGTSFIVINAGAWTHTSVALVDALSGIDVPFVEVHISNTHKREAFRHHSYLSAKAVGVVLGLGTYSYTAAVDYCLDQLAQASSTEKR